MDLGLTLELSDLCRDEFRIPQPVTAVRLSESTPSVLGSTLARCPTPSACGAEQAQHVRTTLQQMR